MDIIIIMIFLVGYIILWIIVYFVMRHFKATINEAIVIGLIAVITKVIIDWSSILYPIKTNLIGGAEARLNDVIYSGDILEIESQGNVLQRQKETSQVRLARPLGSGSLRTNLSKLRFENLDNYGPIRYGQEIYLKHNALIDNKNQVRTIKYGERLQSHQSGPVYNLFKLIKKNKIDSRSYVKYGDSFVIACADQEGDNVHLKLESDNSISSEAKLKDAIIFQAKLIHQKAKNSLCVCPGEAINA